MMPKSTFLFFFEDFDLHKESKTAHKRAGFFAILNKHSFAPQIKDSPTALVFKVSLHSDSRGILKRRKENTVKTMDFLEYFAFWGKAIHVSIE